MKKLLLLLILVSATAISQAQTGYKYNFRNNLHEKNLLGPDLVPSCADTFLTDTIPAFSLVRPVYSFSQNCGVNFSDAANFLAIGDYTIEMYVSLDSVLGYRKMIDYKNISDDGGLYIHDSTLDFFSIFDTGNPLYPDNKYMFTAITRNNADQKVKLYANGTYLGSFTDAAGDAFYNADKLLRFFQNDTLNPGVEASAGKVAYLAIYNYVRDSFLVHTDFTDSLGPILAATNVKNLSTQSNIELWPNPASDVLQVSSITELPYVVTDLAGRQVSNGTLLKGENKINVASLARGMYLIKLQADNAGAVYKFIKD